MARSEEGPASGSGPKGEVELVELGQDQQAFARRVAESKATVPHVYFSHELAAAPGLGELVAACGRALREAPLLNSAYRDGNVEQYSRINVAVAVEHDNSTALPVVRDADTKDAAAIGAEIEELRRGVREGSLPSPAFTGATFTVVDVSGVSSYAPIIARGQTATLGAADRSLTLTCDHRVIQGGAAGAQFLGRVAAALAG